MTPEEIKTIRKQLGLTQSAFAERLEIRQKTVSDWENGRHPISRPFIKLIHLEFPELNK